MKTLVVITVLILFTFFLIVCACSKRFGRLHSKLFAFDRAEKLIKLPVENELYAEIEEELLRLKGFELTKKEAWRLDMLERSFKQKYSVFLNN